MSRGIHMTSVDRVLEAIDGGLQRLPSEEWAASVGDPSSCARCQRNDPVDGDLCPGCRAFLLEDSDEDPAVAPMFLSCVGMPPPEHLEALLATLAEDNVEGSSSWSERGYLGTGIIFDEVDWETFNRWMVGNVEQD
jgi:hypothetical protein